MAYRYETGNMDVYHLMKPYARQNRREQTPSEATLWKELRKLPFRFRRQHPIDDYIADFICIEKMLVVEVDGEYHNTSEQKAADAIRTEQIERMGYKVVRYHNDEVENHIDEVIEEIKELLFEEK